MKIRCPNPTCGKDLTADRSVLGRRVKCKACGQTFVASQPTDGPESDLPHSVARSAGASIGQPPKIATPPPVSASPGGAARVTQAERSSAPSTDRQGEATIVRSAAEAAPSLSPGTPKKIGRFEVRRPLGAGAFGAVYRAHDPVLDREIALKVPHASTLESESRRARVLTEAKAAAQLRHPNIVPVFEAGKQENTYYIASAYIEGTTLADAIDERRVDVDRAVAIVRQLAEALDYAHGLGVVHRDVKPENIMLDGRHAPLLMDFGLARVEAGESDLTQDGTVLGTPNYMPPEQAAGRHAEVGPASDQYSLGVVLYKLLCGETPFSGPPSLVISLVINQEPASPRTKNPAISRDLETICLKAMSKERAHRYASCQEMAEDLRRLQAGEPITARRISPAERALRWCKRNPLVAGLAGAAAALLVLVAIVATIGYASTSQALATAETERERAETERERAERALEDVVNAQKERALAQVESLRRAEIGQVPFLIEGLAETWDDVGPRLKELAQQEDLSQKERLRISLALLPEDPRQVDYLRERLLEADPAELPVIREALLPHRESLAPPMWSIVDDPESPEDRRFRAACAMAEFDPRGTGWSKAAEPAVEVLVTENPLHVAAWMEALRPVAKRLVPPLQKIFVDSSRPESERAVATGILADYAAEEPAVLAELICSASAKQFATLMPKLQAHGSQAVRTLEQVVAKEVPQGDTEDDKEKLAKRKANAAAALLRLGQSNEVWPLLEHSPDPRARSYLVHRLAPLGVDPKGIMRRLDEEKDVSIRRALILALGEYSDALLPATDRQTLTIKLLRMYRDDPDAGIHGAAEWLLRQWGQQEQLAEIDRQLAGVEPKAEADWYVAPAGHTMVVIRGPVEFLMGSPTTEADHGSDEGQHRRRIGRSFAVASKSVTFGQWDVFVEANPSFFQLPDTDRQKYGPTPDRPMVAMTWYEAAAYCNWLSMQEGMPKDQWCYEPNESGQYVEGMKPAADFLDRTGYRLPTEAEWEYACRARAATSRYFGETRELLPKYAWYQDNSEERSWPVGSLKPNDFGLFDMHGNVLQWCNDFNALYRTPADGGIVEDVAETTVATDKISRVLRGGSYNDRPPTVRSACRGANQPVSRYIENGFRVARTYN